MPSLPYKTLTGWLQRPKQMLKLILFSVSFLSLPLACLLFAQWPLRELIQAGSRQANDLAQIVFALYVAVAVTAASSSDSHLASKPHEKANQQPPAWRDWVLFACTAPWALFMLWASWPLVINAVLGFERFAETNTPGYFLLKLALPVLLLLVLLQAVLALEPRQAFQQTEKT